MGVKKFLGDFFDDLYSITVYIDTKKVIQTLMFTNRNWIFYFMTFYFLSYMDLTQYHKSTEFPIFCPSKSGSGGVENLPLLCRINFAPTVGA